MVRQKRSSVVLQKAEQRQAGLQSINANLNLGNGLTLEAYVALIGTLRSQLSAYNSTLSDLDYQSRQIKETEQQLRNLSEQMLLGVAAKYGKDSGEYGQAGGVPKSERRRPTRKAAPAAGAGSLSVVPVLGNGAMAEGMNGNGKALVS